MDPKPNLSSAMAKAFPEIEQAEKGRQNPHFKSKYADLSSVTEAIKPALVKHGLWFRQVMHNIAGGVGVETVIHHNSGESLSCGILFVPAAKLDAQGYGSALTYARRYSLQSAFGVCPEDDDGNAAAAATRNREAAKKDRKAQLLMTLQAASLNGLDALKAAFEAEPDDEDRAEVWHEHSMTLKRAAKAAGEQAA